jgi:hypothetical protein
LGAVRLTNCSASLTGDETTDILNYHREHPDFPHQSTKDQWFSESQLEAYRRLGQHVVEWLLEPVGAAVANPLKAVDLFKKLKDKWPYRAADAAGRRSLVKDSTCILLGELVGRLGVGELNRI